MESTKTVKEAYVFLGLTLALSWFVFWGPLALFKIPAASFVSDVKCPLLAILATTFALMIYLASQAFDRESILTRWR